MKFTQFFIFILFLSSTIEMYAQKELKGEFCNYQHHFSQCINFKNDSVFSYKTNVHMTYGSYGKGVYILSNRKLILNYNKTEIKQNKYSHYKFSKWINNDSIIELNFNIKDKHGYMESVSIWIDSLKTGIDSNSDGLATLKLKQTDEHHFINIAFLGYYPLKIKILGYFNYHFDIVLEEEVLEPIPIKNRLEVFILKNIRKNSFTTLNQEKEKLIWKKLKE